jgi:acyl-CoA thioesterase FadM
VTERGGVFAHGIVTRGTEIDWTGTVGVPVFLRYFEHMRWELMRDPRLGLVAEIHEGHFFVVREQVVEVRRRVGLGVALTLETRIVDVGRSTVRLTHMARRVADGALVAEARVTGIWMGPARRMVRLSDGFRARVRAVQEAEHEGAIEPEPVAEVDVVARDETFARSFIAPPEVVFPALGVADGAPTTFQAAVAFEHVVVVPPRDLDVFLHVNAATWLHYCDDARVLGAAAGALAPELAAHGWVVRAGLFYGREASLGDRLRIAVWWIDAAALGFACRRDGESEVLCAVRVDLAPGARAVALAAEPAGANAPP